MIPYFEIYTFNIGPIEIQFWGLMVALGFVAGILYLYIKSDKAGLSKNQVLDLGFWLIISSLIGARLYHVLNEWSYYSENLSEIFYVWKGGLGWYGGVMASVVVGWWYVRKNKLSFWRLADRVVIALSLGEAIGRFGCLGIHDHLGKPTNFIGGIDINGTTRHETAIYSIFFSLIIFITLLFIDRFYKKQNYGRLTAVYLILYGISSFIVYQFRALDLPGSDPVWGAVRPSQLFSVLSVLIGAWIIYNQPIKKLTKAKKHV